MDSFWRSIIGGLFFGLIFSHGQELAGGDAVLIQQAAKKLGYPVGELEIEPADLNFYGDGKYASKLFGTLVYNPLKVPAYTRSIARTMLNNADTIWTLVYFPWARIDEGVRRGLVLRPDAAMEDSMKKIDDRRSALEACGFDRSALTDLPDSLVSGLLMLLWQVEKNRGQVKAAIAGVSDAEIAALADYFLSDAEGEFSGARIEKIIDNTDFKGLSAAAMDLGFVVQRAVAMIEPYPTGKRIEVVGKLGRIVIGTRAEDRYDNPPYALIIDFGGNDDYAGAGVADNRTPVSLVIDFGGNDRYHGEIGPGTGIGGLGFIIDFGGDDVYTAEKTGCGTGILGQGMLVDLTGDDSYEVEKHGQGAGMLGAGVLADINGNDRYYGFQSCQGFGFVKGGGLLIDCRGDDNYIARDDTVKYPSAQSAAHNASLCQGVGFGLRADYSDGHSLGGGVGVLIDGQGNDRYSCGVFGQGCGYWYGTGILVDFEGDDSYDGVWYTQGAGAHFAVGVLIDSLGNDAYRCSMNMGIGAGHDFTLGFFADYEGDDRYQAPNLSLGGGNANGMGVFVDVSGDDEYRTGGGIVLGGASTASRGGLRDQIKTIGMFVDGGGRDRYQEVFSGNGRQWKQKPPLAPVLATEHCLGIDF